MRPHRLRSRPRSVITGGVRARYNGMIGGLFSNSMWDARSHSLTGAPVPKPDYYNVHLLSTFGGPVKVPRLQNRLNVFVGFQRVADDNAITQPG